MKIMQINAVCGQGSTGRICTDIAEELEKCGHKCRVLYASGSSNFKDSIKIVDDKSLKKNALFARITGLTAYGAIKESKRIISKIEEFTPDVVHLHNLHGNYVNINYLLKYLGDKGIATVITLHDCWFFTGKCTHYTSENCYKWKCGCGDCPKLKDDIPSWFFDRTSKMWRDKKNAFNQIPRLGVIGVSDWITNEAKQSFLMDAPILKRIYNWINTTIFYPRARDTVKSKYSIADDKFIVFCASAGWRKESVRYKDLLKLAELLPESMQLVVAGRLPEGTIHGKIHSVGFVSDPIDLAGLYSAADVYVHLSREDTFGKVIVEAQACGTPAIVYNTTACPELIHNNCGYVAEVGNIQEVLKYITAISLSGKVRFSANCIETAREHYEKTALILETIKLYETLANM